MYNRADGEYRKKFDVASYGTKPMQSFNSTAEPHILMAMLELMEKQNEILERISKKIENIETKAASGEAKNTLEQLAKGKEDKAIKSKETKKK